MARGQDTTGAATSEASLADPAPLPPPKRATGRAFVVQIAPECGPEGELQGRVQHLDTSDGGNFGSLEGLAAIVRRVLERRRD